MVAVVVVVVGDMSASASGALSASSWVSVSEGSAGRGGVGSGSGLVELLLRRAWVGSGRRLPGRSRSWSEAELAVELTRRRGRRDLGETGWSARGWSRAGGGCGVLLRLAWAPSSLRRLRF